MTNHFITVSFIYTVKRHEFTLTIGGKRRNCFCTCTMQRHSLTQLNLRRRSEDITVWPPDEIDICYSSSLSLLRPIWLMRPKLRCWKVMPAIAVTVTLATAIATAALAVHTHEVAWRGGGVAWPRGEGLGSLGGCLAFPTLSSTA